MYLPITYKLLKSKKACKEQLDLVKKHFGLKPIPLTRKVVNNFSELFDVEWIADRLLTDPDFKEYVANRYIALTKYTRTIKNAWAERTRNTSDKTSYNYKTATEIALSDFKKTIATEFVRLYKCSA